MDDVDDTTIGRRNCVIVEATMVVIDNNNNIMIVVVVIVVAAVVGDYCKGTNLLFYIYVTLFLFPIAGIVEWSGSGVRVSSGSSGERVLFVVVVCCVFFCIPVPGTPCSISWNDDVTTTSIKEIDV